ncbi:MAG: DUF6463 family protein [Breznakibacter sp.]
MQIRSKLTNGVLIILIALLHLQLAVSADAFGTVFRSFARSGFYKISGGLNELPFVPGVTNTDTFAAFWFFYFGVMLIPLGLLIHTVEKHQKALPPAFTVAYLLVVAMGSYMIPASGMTCIMLPHAVYMLAVNIYKARKAAHTHNSRPGR